MRVLIEPVEVPDDVARPAARNFIDFIDVSNACALDTWGNDDFVYAAADELFGYRSSEFRVRLLELARLDGDAVGALCVTVPLDEGATTATIDVRVMPPARGRGIGSALLARAEELVAEAGRIDISVFSEHGARFSESGSVIHPTVGTTPLPEDAPVRFATEHGYRLGQVELVSEVSVPLPVERAAALLAEATPRSGGYRVVTWRRRCPDELVDSFARACARMVLDVPHEGIALDEEEWNAARVREAEDRMAAGGEPLLTSAAVHEATGEIAAYTEIAVPAANTRAMQYDTLVTGPNRGHRLGMLVKLANLRALHEAAPTIERVITWNADENAPMRAINEALGFTPIGYEGNWQKRLP